MPGVDSVLLSLSVCALIILVSAKIMIDRSNNKRKKVKEMVEKKKIMSDEYGIPVESKREMIHRRIMDNQWLLIERRLDFIEEEGDDEDENTSGAPFEMFSSARKYGKNCTGRISLDEGHYDGSKKEKITPLKLVKENRIRLEELGFEITDDQCWAIYNENFNITTTVV